MTIKMRDIMSAAPVCIAHRIPGLENGVPVGAVSADDLALEADPAPCAWTAPS